MKAVILVLTGAVGLFVSGAAASAQLQLSTPHIPSYQTPGYAPPQYVPRPQLQARQIAAAHHAKLVTLRAEALDQRARDGGTLTAAHYAQIQSKLDAINADYRRYLRNNDILSVGTDARR